jgi:hypothetical protein
LDQAGVVELAEAIVRRELRSARGNDALDRVQAARPCVSAAEPELRERTASFDDAGAAALLLLADAGKLSREPFVGRYARDARGAFRAVAARGSGSRAHASLRRGFFLDPDERVRREALRAAAEAADPADLEAVLEAARLDPDGTSRSLAMRAVGRIGGERAVTGLADLWEHADETVKLAIIDAWAMSGVLDKGGRDALIRTAEAADSMGSVSAAAALVRAGGDAARIGRAVLIRAVREGTTEERVVAVELAPLPDPDVTVALDAAADSDDLAVRVAALGRLLQVPARRAVAITKLEAAAKGVDGAARQARLTLASAADSSVAPLLEHDLVTGAPSFRERAAIALFRLGKASRMATSLADPDPSVRMGVACSLVSDSGPT